MNVQLGSWIFLYIYMNVTLVPLDVKAFNASFTCKDRLVQELRCLFPIYLIFGRMNRD